MRELNLDVAICPGGPSHWSFGGGMLWLSGHWEWHALAAYVVFPLEGEPTLIYAHGRHAYRGGAAGDGGGALRRAVEPQRPLRRGDGRSASRSSAWSAGASASWRSTARHEDYLPVNQYNDLKKGLPEAELVFTKGIMHELLSVHSAEELDCIRHAGKLCTTPCRRSPTARGRA